MRHGAIVFWVLGSVALAKIPKTEEPIYARAVLAYQEKRWADALKGIEQLSQKSSPSVESLELKALILKAQGDRVGAKSVYSQLLNRKNTSDSSLHIGLYAFELGKIYFEDQKFDEAKKYLSLAIQEKANIESSYFLLGKMAWNKKQWKESREYFSKASQAAEYRASAKLFIAETYQKENQSKEALSSYAEARDSAQEQLEKNKSLSEETQKLNQSIVNVSQKTAGLSASKAWLKEVGFSSGYDSNVLFSPNVGDSTNVKAEGSIKQAINWNFQYSPVLASSRFQKWGYQGGINYNFNQQTQAGQFFAHDLSYYLGWGTVQEKHYGFKVSGLGSLQFRNQGFRPFSLSGSLGPFVKTSLNEAWWIGGETFFEPIKVYQDNLISTGAKRSGWAQVARVYLMKRNPSPRWSPSVILSGTLMRPSGIEFQGIRVNLDFTNTMLLNSKTFLANTVGLFTAKYPERSLGVRNDKGVMLGAAAGHQISSPWLLMAQLDFQRNFSDDSNFEFQRVSAMFSGNYRF